MRYSEMLLVKFKGDRDWSLSYFKPDVVKDTTHVETATDLEGIKIKSNSKDSKIIYFPENHPLFNLFLLRSKFYNMHQWLRIVNQVGKTFTRILSTKNK